jgi:hypothetical protein
MTTPPPEFSPAVFLFPVFGEYAKKLSLRSQILKKSSV